MTTSRILSRLLLLCLILSPSLPVLAQSTEQELRDDLMQHFAQLSSKATDLSEAIPADLYDWSPGEGVMSIGHVLSHIARYNYMYLNDNLGVDSPPGLDLDTMEDIRDKDRLVPMLASSVDHVRNHIPDMTQTELSSDTRLYGRDVNGWAVLVQLVSHLGEHVGQLVAYSRMNGIVPPWSS